MFANVVYSLPLILSTVSNPERAARPSDEPVIEPSGKAIAAIVESLNGVSGLIVAGSGRDFMDHFRPLKCWPAELSATTLRVSFSCAMVTIADSAVQRNFGGAGKSSGYIEDESFVIDPDDHHSTDLSGEHQKQDGQYTIDGHSGISAPFVARLRVS
jgi:hypothetical protein